MSPPVADIFADVAPETPHVDDAEPSDAAE